MEMLLVSALTLTIGVFMFPLGISFYRVQMHNEAQEGLQSVLRKAHSFAVTNRNGEAYGVRILSDAYVGFRGASYETRDETVDELYPVSRAITLSGLTEVVFESQTGMPSDTGSLWIDSEDRHSQIIVTSNGLVQ
jgi:hypothetical protein